VLGKALAGPMLILAGFGVGGALAGFVCGGIVASIVGLTFINRRLNALVLGPVRTISMGTALPMFGASLGLALLLNLDLIALKLFQEDRSQVGFYQAGIVLANAPYYLVTAAFVPVLFTQLARAAGDAARRGLTAEVLRRVVLLLIPIEILLMLAAEPALRTFFPDAYIAGADTLRLLAAGNSIMLIVAVLTADFQATGRACVPAVVLLGVAAVEAVVLRLVVPEHEATGAASTFTITAAVSLVALAAVYRRSRGNP
jgi:O-antigen/teichoic acid export membrane protein